MVQRRQTPTNSRSVDRLLALDYFGESFFMKLDAGITKLNSWSGFVFSVLLILILGGYAGQKLDVLVNNGDIDIFETEIYAYFDDTHSFGAENDLHLAVAFTAYDSVREPILDPTIGELAFKAFEWGVDNGTPFVR